MKKNWLIITGIIVLISVLIGILFLYFDHAKKERIPLDNTPVSIREEGKASVYEERKISELVTILNGEILEDALIDTDTLGEKQVEFTYLDENKKKKRAIVAIEVVDKTPPLVWVNGAYTITVGSKQNLLQDIMCADNYDKRPTCKIEGEYHQDKVGNYPLTFYASDSSGNETKIPFTLRVVEKKNNTTTPKEVTFQSVQEEHKTSSTKIGIDVSKWQKEIDFNKVKESGVEFVMMRLGTQEGVGKSSIVDPYFERNLKGFQKAGIEIGVYYYSYAKTKEEAKEQARFVIDTLKREKLDLPVAFDFECWNLFNTLEISLHDLNEIAKTFLEEIESAGYTGMLYGSKNYLERVWNMDSYPIWLAHYTKKTTYQKDYMMWQLTSTGKIDGIKGYVDIDVMYSDHVN